MRAMSQYDSVLAVYCDIEPLLSSQDVKQVLADNKAYMIKSVQCKSRTNGCWERTIGVLTTMARCAIVEAGFPVVFWLQLYASTRGSRPCTNQDCKA